MEDLDEFLPPERLLPSERNLVAALIAVIKKHWRRECEALSVEQASQDADVRGCSALLPSVLSLRDWIDERVAFEIKTRRSRSRGCVVLALAEAENFFSQLPKGALTRAELDLEQYILATVEQKLTRSDQGVKLSDVAAAAGMQKCMNDAMPAAVQLGEWIQRRIAGTIHISRKSYGPKSRRRGPPELSLVQEMGKESDGSSLKRIAAHEVPSSTRPSQCPRLQTGAVQTVGKESDGSSLKRFVAHEVPSPPRPSQCPRLQTDAGRPRPSQSLGLGTRHPSDPS